MIVFQATAVGITQIIDLEIEIKTVLLKIPITIEIETTAVKKIKKMFSVTKSKSSQISNKQNQNIEVVQKIKTKN